MAKRNLYNHFLKIWHYHPELELVSVVRSTGTRFIGDSIEKFNEGEVILIGKNLPHMWLNDNIYFDKESKLKAEAIAVHFKKEFLGRDFFDIPEMKHISDLFERAARGIKFVDIDNDLLSRINGTIHLKSFKLTHEIIDILHLLARHKNYVLLSSIGYLNGLNKRTYNRKDKRLDSIYEYIFSNFQKPITANDVSQVANMNYSAFSRFFKRVYRKTFTQYLNEVRIGYACKLLIENSKNISEVCYESGFNSISNFNKQFKLITQMSPTQYVESHS